MTYHHDFITQLEGYLEEYDGSTPLPDDVRDAIRAQLPSIPQRLPWWPAWNFPTMSNTMRIGVGAAVLAAAAALGFNYIVGPNIGGPVIGDPTPTATPIPANFDDQNGENLAPGSYLMTEIEPFRITITVPEGWQNVWVPGLVWGEGAALAFWKVDYVHADPCDGAWGALAPVRGSTVDDLVTALDTVPAVVLSTPSDVTVDGFAGKQIDLRFDGWDSCTGREPVLWPIRGADAKPAPAAGEVDRLWILDVNGDRLVIVSNATKTATVEVQAELDAIFESIQIEAP